MQDKKVKKDKAGGNKEDVSMPAGISKLLMERLQAEFLDSPKNSILFEYKAAELESGYINRSDSGKEPQEYDALCMKYEAAVSADKKSRPGKVTEYLEFVIGKLSDPGSGYIFSGRKSGVLFEAGNAGDPVKDKEVLKNFVARWNDRLGAFGVYNLPVYEELAVKAVKATKVAEAYGKVTIPEGKALILDSVSKDMLREIQKECKNICIIKAAGYEIDNWSKKTGARKLNRSLIDLCGERGLLSLDGNSKDADKDQIRKQYADFLYSIFEETDEERKKECGLIFIPVYVDAFTGVSMCIAGRESYYYHEDAMTRLAGLMDRTPGGHKPEKDAGISEKHQTEEVYKVRGENMFCCAISVLEFTDVAAKSYWSSVRFETHDRYTKNMNILDGYQSKSEEEKKEALAEYFDAAYADYIEACGRARRHFQHIDSVPEQHKDALAGTRFYRGLPQGILEEKVSEDPDGARKRKEELDSKYENMHPEGSGQIT